MPRWEPHPVCLDYELVSAVGRTICARLNGKLLNGRPCLALRLIARGTDHQHRDRAKPKTS